MKPVYYLIGCLLLASCGGVSRNGQGRMVEDALGRSVRVPDTVARAVCLRASAIRLVTYAGGADRICGVEEPETRSRDYSHLLAHPELARKPVIGPAMGGEPELIVAARPEVIFMSCTTAGEADELQRRTGIPVFTLEYGDLGRQRPRFYGSLRRIARVLRTEAHTDSLIAYIDAQLAELRHRTAGAGRRPRVYVGGISYKGQKGIASTDPYYPALVFLGADNVASGIDSARVSAINGTYVDWEQLADWNPDVIFIDRGGRSLVEEEFRTRPELHALLRAWRERRVYTLWPYNDHHANFGVMLANAWYAGKVLFPDGFADISPEAKADEILTRFVGAPVAGALAQRWGNYGNFFEP